MSCGTHRGQQKKVHCSAAYDKAAGRFYRAFVRCMMYEHLQHVYDAPCFERAPVLSVATTKRFGRF